MYENTELGQQREESKEPRRCRDSGHIPNAKKRTNKQTKNARNEEKTDEDYCKYREISAILIINNKR